MPSGTVLVYPLTLSLPRVIKFKYLSCCLPINISPHSMENLAFLSLLRWKIIILPILTTPLIHFSLKGWGNVLFELGSERVISFCQSSHCIPIQSFTAKPRVPSSYTYSFFPYMGGKENTWSDLIATTLVFGLNLCTLFSCFLAMGASGMLVIDERHKIFYQSTAALALVSVLCPTGDGTSCIPQFLTSGMPQHPSSAIFTLKICRKPKPSLQSLGKIVVFCDILWYIPCCSLVWLTQAFSSVFR